MSSLPNRHQPQDEVDEADEASEADEMDEMEKEEAEDEEEDLLLEDLASHLSLSLTHLLNHNQSLRPTPTPTPTPTLTLTLTSTPMMVQAAGSALSPRVSSWTVLVCLLSERAHQVASTPTHHCLLTAIYVYHTTVYHCPYHV